MDWKNIIKQALTRGSLTQVELAKLAGCSQSSIGDLMSGRTQEPRYSLGQRLLELANSDAAPDHPVPAVVDIQPAAAGQGV